MNDPSNLSWLFVIPYYNSPNQVRSCLTSIPDGVDILVIDNSLSSHSLPNKKGYRVLSTEPNIGYGRAVNIGVDYAYRNGYAYILVINQDAEVVTLDLEALEITLSHQPNAILTSIALSTDLTLKPHIKRSYGGLFEKDYTTGELQTTYEVSRVGMPALALTVAHARALGLFDPQYHMFFEDWDVIRRNNGPCLVHTSFKIAHDGTGSRNPSYTFEYPYLGSEIIYNATYESIFFTVRRALSKSKELAKRREYGTILKLLGSLFKWTVLHQPRRFTTKAAKRAHDQVVVDLQRAKAISND